MMIGKEEKDIYSTISELMSEFMNIKDIQNKSKTLCELEYEKKCLEIQQRILSLKVNNKKEEEFKNNIIIFIEKIINEKFNNKRQKTEITSKNIKCQKSYNFNNMNKIEKETKEKIYFENKNKVLFKKEKKIDKNNKNHEIYSKIDELLLNVNHRDIIQKLEKIYSINEQDKILELKNHLNNLFNKLKEINDIMKDIQLDENYFQKYFTLVYSVYPFFSKKQKEAISKWTFSKNSENYFEYYKLLINLNEDSQEISNFIFDFLFSCPDSDKKQQKLFILNKNIFRTSLEKKSILYYSYQLYILFKIICKTRDSLYIMRKLLFFKIHFILSNEKIFSFSDSTFSEIYKDLLFIKIFYSTIYENQIKEPYLIKIKNHEINYGEYNLNNNVITNISFLFFPNDNKNYEALLNSKYGIIPHLYNIRKNNINQLIDSSSFYIKPVKEEFLHNLISLIYLKSNFIENNFNEYKSNLINLEKEIYDLAKKNLINNNDCKKIKKYSEKTEYKNIYDNFSKKLSNKMKESYKGKYKDLYQLYPMGSLTEFLSLEESDLDLYLYIRNENKRVEIINALFICLKKICKSVQKILSQRLCLFEIQYIIEDKEISIDLSILGYPPYIHSLLFREYSLIDPRFPMVGLAIKYLKDILYLDKEYFLNSFSWMNLLVNFLQDIIEPPILPKIYSDKEYNKIFIKEIEFGKNKKKDGFVDKENINNFLSCLNKEKIPIPDGIFNKKKIREIYNKKIAKNKNNMSCAEILLKFIEFITFYYKYDTLYSEISTEREGFFNMNDINNIYNVQKKDYDMNRYNYEFYKYFTKIYLNNKGFARNKRIRQGFYLIRDPVDNHYNPGQKFKFEQNLAYFINRLRYCYSVLIRFGSFEILKQYVKEKRKENNLYTF